jgi:hypothetical protein
MYDTWTNAGAVEPGAFRADHGSMEGPPQHHILFDLAAGIYVFAAMAATAAAFVWAVAPLENTEHDPALEALQLGVALVGLATAGRMAGILWRDETHGAGTMLGLSLASFAVWGLLITG